MANNMKKIIITAKNTAELLNDEVKSPAENQVKLKMLYSAVSAGTEKAILTGLVHHSKVLRDGAAASKKSGFPSMAGGYSGSAEVIELGDNVTEFKPGDIVMVHGAGHRQYATVDKKELVKIPDGVCVKQAATTIISGFSLAAVRKAKICLGESCMVVGLGILGLHSIIWAKQSGALPIIAVDFSQERRSLALQLGADYAIDPADGDYRDKVLELTDGKGADTVIEVTGNGTALNQALKATARFGRVVLLGCTRLDTAINFYFDVHCPGIQLIGAHSGARPLYETHNGMFTEMDDCRVILDYLKSGRVDFSPLISEIHSPNDAPEVYNRLAFDKEFPIGVLFDWKL